MFELKSWKAAVAIAALMATPVNFALGQVSTASVSGIVRDSAGAVVPKASLSLLNLANGLERRSESNDTGNFAFLDVRPGDYTLSVGAPGFRTLKLSEFNLVVNQTATFDLKLEVGDVLTSVSVEAVGVGIQAATSELGATMTEKNVKDLPLNGRNFTQLLWLLPGASPVNTMQRGFTGYVGTSVFPSINGQVARSNLFLLDGILNTDTYRGTYSVAPILDTIQEFKVQSHNDQAEFGGVMGGTVNVVTKSGTNEFHGALWEYIRNDAFDARNTFLNSVTPFKQNMFGVTVGGPVWLPKIYNGKNHTFFSAGYEGFRFRSPANSLFRVPTAANLTGDLGDEPRALFNPYTVRQDPNNVNGFVRDPFPGNRIPASMINASMVKFAKDTLPAPVATGVVDRNAIDATPKTQDQDGYNVRIDQNFGQNNFFWFRISGTPQLIGASTGLPGAPSIQDLRGRNIGASYVHTFGSTGVLQAQFGWTRIISTTDGRFTNLPANYFKDLGLSDNLTGNFLGGTRIDPVLSVSGWFAGGGLHSFIRPSEDHQYKVNYSKVHGSHIFKMGAELAPTDNEQVIENSGAAFAALQTADPRSSGNTGSALASFLLGIPDSSNRRNTHESMEFGAVMGLYFADQWKATQRLTVNIGLRYDRNFVGRFGRDEDGNKFSGMLDFNRGVYLLQKAPPSCAVALTAPCLPNGVLPEHVEVLPPGGRFIQGSPMNLQPRLGLAYRLRPGTALRGGFGMVFDNWAGIQQIARSFGGLWPSIGFIQINNLNPFRELPSTKVENPLPSAVIPAANPFGTSAYSASEFKNAYSIQWNLGVQHQVTNSTVLSAYYVASGSRRLDVAGLYNVARTPGPGAPNLRYPYPYMTPSTWDRPWGSSHYHSFQFMADGRFSHGLSYRVSYTWSKSIDYGSSGFFAVEGFSVQTPYDIRPDRSVSNFDLPHMLSTNWVYELPIGRGKMLNTGNRIADYAIGGWQVNGIVLLSSGTPYTLSVAGDLANTGNTNYLRPNVVGEWRVANPTPASWFNPAAFAVPAPYTFGNVGRNTMRSDWMRNLDLSVFRRFPLTGERTRLELRAEAFNTFNTPVYGAPTSSISSTNFGRVFGTANNSRQLQFSLKLSF